MQDHDQIESDRGAPSGEKPHRRGAGVARVVIILCTLAVFWPVVGHDFGGMDDDINVARNPHLNPPTSGSLRYFWTTPQYDLYVPVTYTVWWGLAKLSYSPQPDAAGFHLNPHVFHLFNLMLHVAAALAAFEVLRRCAGRVWPAMFGALLFALHPLQVESVAWVAGMKDVLAGMLAILALWQYLRAGDLIKTRARRRVAWIIGTIAFVLAMLSKPGAVALPAVALAIDWLVMNRPPTLALRRALPWLILAIPCIAWTKLAQPAAAVGEAIGLAVRPLVATDALAFYLWKLAWPVRLGIDYGRTPQVAIENGWIAYTWIAPAALAILALLARRRAPMLTAAFIVFILALLPVLGLVPFDFQAYSTVADHYLYLPMLGPALAMTWFASRRPAVPIMTLAGVILVVLGVLARLQTHHWADAEAIFTRAAQVHPGSWLAYNQLASVHSSRGDFERALDHARRAVELNPRAYPTHVSLAVNLAKLGRFDEAIDAYRAALRIHPTEVVSLTNLANLLAHRKDYAEAIELYERALRADPRSTIARLNLASVYEEMGQPDDARRQYERVLQIDPTSAPARAGIERTGGATERR